MRNILLNNGTMYTPHGVVHNGWIYIEHGIITQLGSGIHPACDNIIDTQGLAILPGFIDVHTHGAVGCDTMQATPHALKSMATFFARHGVTSFLAATITESSALLTQALQAIEQCKGTFKQGATLLGAYLEGPYVNAQAKGAHNEHDIRRAHPREYIPWFDRGIIKQIVVAPEFPENMQLIKDCVRYDIVPSIGHSLATYEQVGKAVIAGARQATHTFNAMAGIHHRAPGTAGGVLTHDAIMCELIADMVHLHPAILTLAVRAKGIDKILLVTDAEIGTGLTPGMYDFGRHHMKVTDDAVYLADGTLAGSVLTMNKALGTIIKATGLTLEAAWPMTSRNAARQLNLNTGELAVGYDADIVVLSPEHYSVAMTIAQGHIVYKREGCL